MQNESYKEALTEAVFALNHSENELFTAMVNIGFNGVYEDISRLHEQGEVLNLELAMFERTGHTNLNILISSIKSVAAAKHSLLNLNELNLRAEDLPSYFSVESLLMKNLEHITLNYLA